MTRGVQRSAAWSARHRPGFMLAEALCALALAALLGVACATALGGVRRAMVAGESRARAERAGIEALEVIAALARDADSVVVLGDTAVELTVRIASGVVCMSDSTSVTLPPVRVATGKSLMARVQPVEPGDELRFLTRDSTRSPARWEAVLVDSVAERSGESPCGSAGGYVDAADASALRMRLVPRVMPVSAGSGVRAGTAVRIGRRGRLALYNAGRGEWMLGWRRCANGTCGVVQPVAGPLRTPAAGGLRIRERAQGVLDVSVAVPGIAWVLAADVTRTDVGR